MIISKTPLRFSFVGGGTDLPSFYQNNEYGAVLSTAIDKYIYVTIKKHQALFTEKIRLNYSQSERVMDIESIENPIIRECLKFLNIDDRIYISTIADVPAQTGLGSSSAFCVGLLNALYKYKGIQASIGQIVDEACHIEIDVLNRPVGKQDHYAAAYGGFNYIRFNADGSVVVQPVNSNEKVANTIFASMISFWTGGTRSADSVLKEQDKNNNKNSDLLISMRDQAKELFDHMHEKDFSHSKIGTMVHEGWLMKKQLSSKVSNTVIDQAYDTAIAHGAIGGKVSGAGNGGFFNIFADKKNHSGIISALAKYGMFPVSFHSAPLGTTVSVID